MESGQADQGKVTLTLQIGKHYLVPFLSGAIIVLLVMSALWIVTKLISKYMSLGVYGMRRDLRSAPFLCGISFIVSNLLGPNWLADFWHWLAELYTRLKG